MLSAKKERLECDQKKRAMERNQFAKLRWFPNCFLIVNCRYIAKNWTFWTNFLICEDAMIYEPDNSQFKNYSFLFKSNYKPLHLATVSTVYFRYFSTSIGNLYKGIKVTSLFVYKLQFSATETGFLFKPCVLF